MFSLSLHIFLAFNPLLLSSYGPIFYHRFANTLLACSFPTVILSHSLSSCDVRVFVSSCFTHRNSLQMKTDFILSGEMTVLSGYFWETFRDQRKTKYFRNVWLLVLMRSKSTAVYRTSDRLLRDVKHRRSAIICNCSSVLTSVPWHCLDEYLYLQQKRKKYQ